MKALSVRDYRNNMAAYFDRAAEGERVLIRRKNTLYALVSIGTEEVSISPQRQRQIDVMTESLRRSLDQVKRIEAGELKKKSAISFLDEL
ncbi:MAG: hypothetical protein HDR95_08195 [Bacteroides sp.]|nr:hypothetical protein [Bacteroides sp.]MBD5337269.1 hypothetical protein [Bacteroides sp.]